MTRKLIFIFIAAFLIRLIALNQSLWLDEAISANVVSHYSFSQIINLFSPTDFHPPLYYLLLKAWTGIFGLSEISLRLPSIIASLITGYLVYLIGKKLKNPSVGLWAAIFFLFNPLIIYYSQEARMYSLQTLFLTASLYYFLRLIPYTKYKIPDTIFFNLFSFLALSTHYGSIFFLVTLFIYLIFKRQFRILLLTLPGPIIALLILSPLLYRQFIYSQVALQSVTNWSLVLGKANFKNLFLIFSKFVTGRISFYPKIIYYLITFHCSLITYFIAFFKTPRFLKYLFLFPLLLAFLISFSSPMLQYFRYLYLIPVLSLLLAFSKFKFLKILLTFNFLTFGLVYLLLPQFHREDWKSLSYSFPQNSTVYLVPSFADPLKYYRPDVTVFDLSKIPEHQSTRALYVIPYGVEIYGLDYRSSLNTLNYSLSKTTNFRQITLEVWDYHPGINPSNINRPN